MCARTRARVRCVCVSWHKNDRFVFRHPQGAAAPDVAVLRSQGARLPCYSITELCSVPTEALEGRVLVSLQVSPIEMDAAPSRPLLYYLRSLATAAV